MLSVQRSVIEPTGFSSKISSQTECVRSCDEAVLSGSAGQQIADHRLLFWKLIGGFALYWPSDVDADFLHERTVTVLQTEQAGVLAALKYYLGALLQYQASYEASRIVPAIEGEESELTVGARRVLIGALQIEKTVEGNADALTAQMERKWFSFKAASTPISTSLFRPVLFDALQSSAIQFGRQCVTGLEKAIELMPKETMLSQYAKTCLVFLRRDTGRVERLKYADMGETVHWLQSLLKPGIEPALRDHCLEALMWTYLGDQKRAQVHITQLTRLEKEHQSRQSEQARQELLAEYAAHPKQKPSKKSLPRQKVAGESKLPSDQGIVKPPQAPAKADALKASPVMLADLLVSPSYAVDSGIQRWETIRSLKGIRALRDPKEDGSSYFPYQNGSQEELLAVLQRHYFPDLAQVLSSAKVREYYCRSIEDTLVIKAARWDAEGKVLVPQTLMTVMINSQGVLYHAFMHPVEEVVYSAGNFSALKRDVSPKPEELKAGLPHIEPLIELIPTSEPQGLPCIRLGRPHPAQSLAKQVGFAVLFPLNQVGNKSGRLAL